MQSEYIEQRNGGYHLAGAIAFYLDYQAEIDEYLVATEREFEAGGIPLAEENPELWARLQHARATMGKTRS